MNCLKCKDKLNKNNVCDNCSLYHNYIESNPIDIYVLKYNIQIDSFGNKTIGRSFLARWTNNKLIMMNDFPNIQIFNMSLSTFLNRLDMIKNNITDFVAFI